MLEANQTVYYTSGPYVQEATFIRYDSSGYSEHESGEHESNGQVRRDCCILRTPLGDLKTRKGRVFTVAEAMEQGLLDSGADARIREAFAV